MQCSTHALHHPRTGRNTETSARHEVPKSALTMPHVPRRRLPGEKTDVWVVGGVIRPPNVTGVMSSAGGVVMLWGGDARGAAALGRALSPGANGSVYMVHLRAGALVDAYRDQWLGGEGLQPSVGFVGEGQTEVLPSVRAKLAAGDGGLRNICSWAVACSLGPARAQEFSSGLVARLPTASNTKRLRHVAACGAMCQPVKDRG
jgi:hypothetical protein